MELILTNGATRLDLNDGVNYGIPYDQWSPMVARRRVSQMGGSGLYEDVLEEIPLHVRGATGTAALKNLARLVDLLDTAERWWRGGFDEGGNALTAVRLQYTPTGGTETAQAVVLGAPGNELVGLSPRVNDAGNYEIDGITLRLLRRGQWLVNGGDELISNPSMETFAAGNFTGWTQSGTPTLAQVSTPLVDGDYAASISTTSTNHGIYQDFAVTAGLTVTVTVWVYLTTGTLIVRLTDDGTFSGGTSSTVTTLNRWQRVTLSHVAPVSGLVRVSVRSSTATSAFFVDGVSSELAAYESASSAATDNGEVVTVALTEFEKTPSPCDLTVSNVRANETTTFVAVVDGDSGIALTAAEDMLASSAPRFSVVADSAAYSRTGDVRRYTPDNTSEYYLAIDAAVTTYRYAIFASVRNNSASTTFYLRASTGTLMYTPTQIINPQASARPEWVYLGELVGSSAAFTLLRMRASAASGTLDIDTVALVSLERGDATIVALSADTAQNSAGTLEIKHRLLSDPTAIAEGAIRWITRGNLQLYARSNRVSVLLMGTGDPLAANTWRQTTSAAVLENTWTLERYSGRLILQ